MFGKKAIANAVSMIPGVVIALVIAGVVMAAGLKAMGSFKGTLDANSAERNATDNTINGVVEISKQMPTIGIIAAMVIILMLIGGLAAYFTLR